MKPLAKKADMGSTVFRLYIVGICFLLVFPLAVVGLISFDTSSYIGFPPKGLHFEWYRSLPENPNFYLSFKNSLVVALVSTGIAVLVAVPAALLITRFQFRGRDTLYAVLMSSLTVPWIVYGVALLLLWTNMGLRLGLDTLIFGHAVIGAPYVLRTAVAVLADMPSSYERGARSLGAGPLRTFFSITLPLMAPGLRAGAAFAFIVSFVNIPVSLFVTGRQHHSTRGGLQLYAIQL